jgi:hypothetical protein
MPRERAACQCDRFSSCVKSRTLQAANVNLFSYMCLSETAAQVLRTLTDIASASQRSDARVRVQTEPSLYKPGVSAVCPNSHFARG